MNDRTDTFFLGKLEKYHRKKLKLYVLEYEFTIQMGSEKGITVL